MKKKKLTVEDRWDVHPTSTGALIHIETPANRNAWNLEKSKKFLEFVTKLSQDGGKVVGLAMGRPWQLPFCSGGDLSAVGNLERGEAIEIHEGIRRTLDQLSTIPIILEMFVGGDVWGGGWELLSVADQINGWAEAKILFQQIHWGIGPGWGGGARFRPHWPELQGLILSGGETNCRQLAARGLIRNLLPRTYFDQPRSLQKWMSERWQFLEEPSLRDVQDITLALRSGSATEEARVFESLWGRGIHEARLRSWMQRRLSNH